ncbi:MAG: 3-deoxy-manno-octulosonate cytidylyltransferase [Ferruginibacter sp.]|nr:3-deoxy-manno-octulosonate cytidylyltransferase [Ferruginibacter sp.]
MKKIAMIPARYQASRFPGKLMQHLGGKTVIRMTYENTLATGLFEDVYVVTDSPLIRGEIELVGGKVIMSKKKHESGSDRIAEAVENMEVDIILNVQGDSPLVNTQSLSNLLQVFNDPEVKVASLMQKFENPVDALNPNNVKVVVDLQNNSLLFSRHPIPFHRDPDATLCRFEHKGVYAFRKDTLIQFSKWPVTPLEAAEKIECLRYLEHGILLKMVLTEKMGVEIDTPEDLERAKRMIE